VTPFPVSLVFDKEYFLGIRVDNGTELVPRTALTAVPYALHATIAEGVTTNATGVVTSVNNQAGAITLQGGGGTTITNTGGTFMISSVGGSGTGIQGVQNTDGTLTVQNANGPVATLAVADNGIGMAKLQQGAITPSKINTTGAQSGQVLGFNGASVAWTTPTGGGAGVQSVQSADGSLAISNAGGPIVGAIIAPSGVSTDKIAANAVTVSKLGTPSNPAPGQVLTATFSGMDWQTFGGGLTLPYYGFDTVAADLFTIIDRGAAVRCRSR